MNCIFCKIVTKKIKESVVYEDNQILAFMDNRPIRKGQLLVIPKKHINHFSDISNKLASKIFLKAHQISKNIKKITNCERVGLIVHGYGVAHAHIIVLPQHNKNDITSARIAKCVNKKIIFTRKKITPRKELEKIAKIIKKELV